jgi:hypothetical protein
MGDQVDASALDLLRLVWQASGSSSAAILTRKASAGESRRRVPAHAIPRSGPAFRLLGWQEQRGPLRPARRRTNKPLSGSAKFAVEGHGLRSHAASRDHSCQGPEQFIPKEPGAGKALPKTPPGPGAGEVGTTGEHHLGRGDGGESFNTLRRALHASPADADRPRQIS